MTAAQLTQQLTECLDTLIRKIHRTFPGIGFPWPIIEYSPLPNRDALAFGYNQKLILNQNNLWADPDRFFDDVIPHHLAHLVVYKLYPSSRPHGKEWKFVCEKLGFNHLQPCSE